MRDIFICPHGNLLANWYEACPKAMVSTHLQTVPVVESVLFWLHTNANSQAWLEATMVEIAAKYKTSKVVVLANVPSQTEALAAISKGAVGYCHAYSSAQVLAELRTVVLHGGIWLGQDLLQTLIGASRKLVHNSAEQASKALALLTPRAQEVALQAAAGLSNKEIARALDITERTVKAHVSSALERLGVKDRLQLALVLNDKSAEFKKSPASYARSPKVNKSTNKHAAAKSSNKSLVVESTEAKKKLDLAA